MKFIRNWIKKVIAETLMENFPPCNIYISETANTENKIAIHGGTFRASTIRVSKLCENQNAFISDCSIDMTDMEEPFITTGWDETEDEKE
jgi:hypothetical protein